jgi:hypothetical protein
VASRLEENGKSGIGRLNNDLKKWIQKILGKSAREEERAKRRE